MLGRDIKYIPNGILIRPKQGSELITNLLLKKEEYFLYVGRITYGKGLEYLIPAFTNTDTTKKLIIAGYQNNADAFEKQIKNMAAWDCRISFLGFVELDLLDSLYSNAFCVIHPSESESNSIVTLEALMFNNCLLASNIPGIVNIAKDYAIYFEPRNVEELSKKIQFLCDNPQVVIEKKKATEGFISNSYQWSFIIKKYIHQYNDLLKLENESPFSRS